MGRQQRQPQRLTLVTLRQQILDRHDIAERLRHLLRAHVDEAVVDPVAREWGAGVGAAALGEFVLVMGEDEVLAAAVDVDCFAQVRADHRAAFDVPPGAAPPPRAVPANLCPDARLPQHKVGGVALVGGDLDPRAGDHRLAVATAEAAIIRVGRDREQDMVRGLIGMAEPDQPLDHRHHRANLGGGVRRDRRRGDAERAHVVEIVALVALGDHPRLDPFRLRRRDDPVVDVGDVARIDHAVGAKLVADRPGERVEHHRRAGVADVGVAVDRGAADIHGDAVRVARGEFALLARHRVVEADHSFTPGWRRVSTQSTIARPLALSSG